MTANNLENISKRQNKDYDYWSIVKGLGIVAIVIGHSGSFLTEFVYLFHLAIFFFVSGYFYKDKYGWKEYVLKKIKSLWVPFFIYGLIAILLHNLFVELHIYSNTYTLRSIVKRVALLFTFKQDEMIVGAIWFLPLLFGGMIIYDLSYRASRFFSKTHYRIPLVIITFCLSLIGYTLIKQQIDIPRNLDITLLILPLILAGNIAHDYANKIRINWVLGLFSLAILLLSLMLDQRVEFSLHEIPIFPAFYLISLAGLLFVLCLALYIGKTKLLAKIFSTLGKYSLHIMALHFLAFKLVSWAGIVIDSKPLDLLYQTTGISEYWLAYTIVGLTIPVGLIFLMKKLPIWKIIEKSLE